MGENLVKVVFMIVYRRIAASVPEPFGQDCFPPRQFLLALYISRVKDVFDI